MKLILLIISSLLFINSYAQDDESTSKVIRGFITRRELSTDTSFKWFIKNQNDYTPDPSALKALRSNKDSVYFLAFGGTWCSDTKFILPKFFVLADAAGISPDRITIIGVDRNKKTIEHLSETFNIENVPTIIVMKNGKEIGRVVEYGKHGMFDRELGEVVEGKNN